MLTITFDSHLSFYIILNICYSNYFLLGKFNFNFYILVFIHSLNRNSEDLEDISTKRMAILEERKAIYLSWRERDNVAH